MVWSNIHVGFTIYGSLNSKFATTWIYNLLGLYIIVKSYSKNNNNHWAILPITYGLLIK